MSQLIRLKDIQATHRDLIGDDYYDPTGKTAIRFHYWYSWFR